jgi:Family of unknown function (DUF6069)
MTNTSTTAHDLHPPARQRSRTRRARGYAVLAAAGAGLLGWAVAGPAAGVHLTVRTGAATAAQHIGPAAVTTASLLAGLAGWALLAFLERHTPKARTIWTVIALVVLAGSLTGPIGGVTAAAKIALVCLHLLVAAVLIIGLRRPARYR